MLFVLVDWSPENQKKEETRQISKFLLQTDYTERRT